MTFGCAVDVSVAEIAGRVIVGIGAASSRLTTRTGPILAAFGERAKEFNGLARGRARSEARSMQATPYPGSTTGESGSRPNWLVLAASEVAAAGLFSFAASPRTALYWYIFPLFGLGVCYVVQFRSELTRRWTLTFAGSAVLSAVALGLDWPFSGHVLWNVLFIGHAWMTAKLRTAWMALMAGSLVYLVVLKVAFQTSRDVAGAALSAALAAAALLALRQPRN